MAHRQQTATAETELEPADVHDVLRNDRRRLTLQCLREADADEMTLNELSERVAALETGTTPAPRDKRQSVYVSLNQTHLPKLDGLEIISYDSDAQTVSLAERAPEVTVYMEVVPEYGLLWGEYYFGLGLLAALTTIAALVGVPGLSQVDVTVVALAFYVFLMGSAAYQVYSQQDPILFQRLRS
ncbi:hypothetical protein [Halosegnis sp.]|uniref:DUF7344 domain-containing protein n=1 Tax=Halosegnis sp. TaxID=2864959 RepID=UPI0035D4BBF9